jgi:hypothetical protein
MQRTASTLAAAALTLWALVGIAAQQQQQQPAPAPAPAQPAAPRVSAPAAASALGDYRTLSRYPGP